MSGPVCAVWDPGLNRLGNGQLVVPGIVIAHTLNEQEFEFRREADTKYLAGALTEEFDNLVAGVCKASSADVDSFVHATVSGLTGGIAGRGRMCLGVLGYASMIAAHASQKGVVLS